MTYFVEHDKASGSGSFVRATAGENLGDRKLVYLDSNGAWRLSDADAAASMPAIGLTMDVIASGAMGWILTDGWIGLSTWTWTAGGEIYASTTAGELTQTAPPTAGVLIQVMGVASTATQMKFSPHYGPPGDLSNTLEGSTAYVGFDETKDPKVNYFYCDGTADDVQINLAEAYVTALGGGTVELERGTFSLVAPIIPTGDNIWYKGQGPDTFLDGDGLATTEHVFHITARDAISISDIRMQTQGGGTKTCHCIFMENGSDDFHITHVIIDDSDDNGIHIEGTDTALGHIHDCHINSTDGHGIYVNMDGGETIEQLHIVDNDITGVGGSGIYFDASGGNDNCAIEANKIATATAVGIYVDDFTGGQIRGNTCRDGGSHGIQVVGSDEVSVSDNFCVANGGHGIYFESSSDEGLIDGNVCNDNDSGDTATYDGIHIATACTFNTVINNTCLRNHRNGIYTIGVNNQINNNLVAENDLHGIQLSGGDCQVNSNHITDNSQDAAGTSHGIHVMGSADRTIVMGNHIDGVGDSHDDGIQLSNGATEVIMIGNLCQDGMGSGINLSANNDDCTIIGNYLFANDLYGIEINGAGCDHNTVQSNKFSGNLTGAVLDTGTHTIFHTKQYYVARDDDNINQTPGKSITNGQTAYIAVHATHGLQQIMGFDIFVIPNATQGAADWDLATSYGAIGEANNTHAETEAAATYNVTNLQWFAIDAFGAGMFASMEEEDTGGVSLTVGTAGHDVMVVMAEMYYV